MGNTPGEYNSYDSWTRGLRRHFTGYKIEGDKDIAQAYIMVSNPEDNGHPTKRKYIGEWDGAIGSIGTRPLFAHKED